MKRCNLFQRIQSFIKIKIAYNGFSMASCSDSNIAESSSVQGTEKMLSFLTCIPQTYIQIIGNFGIPVCKMFKKEKIQFDAFFRFNEKR